MKDGFNLTRGYWEAKDTGDDLDEEIRKKIARGYPLANTIFEDTRRAVLYQNRQQAMDVPLTDRKRLADLLSQFFSYEEPDIVAFGKAIEEFRTIIPDLAGGLETIIHEARGTNIAFVAAFDTFRTTCRASIDPHITDIALEEMLVQHLLTERLFRTVFNNPDFTKRNVIAAEIENVITALASKSFSRDDFLMALDRYYRPIEEAAAKKTTDWSEKQTFLNTVYERFFQGFSTRQADTHGIVYTPQEIVDFMVNSVEEVLLTGSPKRCPA
jgi:predicted helicase